jgi:hypothetical protein
MAGLDLSSLSNLQSNLTSLLPTSGDILQNLAVGAGASVVMAGLKSGAGQDAIDPLHLFHSATPANNPNAVIGPTASASAFTQMGPQGQAAFLAAGGHVVAG